VNKLIKKEEEVKISIQNIKTKILDGAKTISTLLLGCIIGGATSAVVMAAIPDANGIIHGCRANAGGALRVVNSEAGGTCLPNETSLNWSQTGPQGEPGEPVAYGYVDENGDLDTDVSSGITSVSRSLNSNGSEYRICFELDSPAVNIQATDNSSESSGSPESVSAAIAGVGPYADEVTDICGSSAEAMARVVRNSEGINTPIFVVFH
jgi:hypothetical protein